MLALALALLSLAQIALAPIALAVAAVVVAWSAAADIEIAIVVSKRRPDGRKGQQVVGSVRLTPRRAARAAAGAVAETARAAGAAARAAGAAAETARGGAARWTETEQASRWADRARAAADIGPAVGVLCAVWALPWIAIVAPDGAGAAAGVCAALALARHLTAGAGLRYRADV